MHARCERDVRGYIVKRDRQSSVSETRAAEANIDVEPTVQLRNDLGYPGVVERQPTLRPRQIGVDRDARVIPAARAESTNPMVPRTVRSG
jgi:hypothetical protein